jgi:hypothetical protein
VGEGEVLKQNKASASQATNEEKRAQRVRGEWNNLKNIKASVFGRGYVRRKRKKTLSKDRLPNFRI